MNTVVRRAIPFHRPSLAGHELEYVRQVLEGRHLAGDGPFTARCERELEALLGAPRVFLTTSCTHALEMMSLLLEIRPGDEVVVPSFTFLRRPMHLPCTAHPSCLRISGPIP